MLLEQYVEESFHIAVDRGVACYCPIAPVVMMMIAFITFKSSLVPLFEGLWSSNSWEFELSGFRRTISLMMSASGFPCIEGDFPSPVHFWEEERRQAESDRRITGFLSCWFLASSSARHAAPNSALFDEFPSTPRPNCSVGSVGHLRAMVRSSGRAVAFKPHRKNILKRPQKWFY